MRRFLGPKARATFRYVAEDAPSGYGDAADRLVRAVRAAGARVEYRGWSAGREGEGHAGLHAYSRDPWPTERAPRRAPVVAHLIPERLTDVRSAVGRAPLVSHTVWETDRLPLHWPDLLNRVDRVVVPTEWNREAFVASGVTAPVVVVPHVACDPVPGDGGVPLKLPDDVLVFYTIARWDQRKAPDAVLRAFLDAFTSTDPVALVVKTSAFAQFPAPGPWGHRSPLAGTTVLEVARLMRDKPDHALVRVETEDWSPSQVAGLHARGDCYISLTHGEGWGLGAFDAAAYGNPVIMTGWGGPLAYLDDETSFLVDHDVTSVQHWEPRYYGPNQQWALPSHDHAIELMRGVANDLRAARRRAAPLRAKVLRDFAPERVAATFFEVVPELAALREVSESEGGRASVRLPERSRTRHPGDEPLLLGMTVGPWRPAFDNWMEMAERYGYRYELIGLDIAEPFVAHATKWRVLLDTMNALPDDQIVFYVDASDGFVCDRPRATLDRYRSYETPVVLSAESIGSPRIFDVPDPKWHNGCAGAFVGTAGAVADALREGYELVDWSNRIHVSDQLAMLVYFLTDDHRDQGTVDYRRVLVQNVASTPERPEVEQHRRLLDGGGDSFTSAVHCFGDNGRDYNALAQIYGLAQVPITEEGRFGDAQSPIPSRLRVEPPTEPIPRIVHFVWAPLDASEPFRLVHCLAVLSCLEVVAPDAVHVHYETPPSGPYWDLVSSRVVVRRAATPGDPACWVLDALAEPGGLYADLDSLFIAPVPEKLWRTSFVIGRAADTTDESRKPWRPSLSTSLLMSRPDSEFVQAWRAALRAMGGGDGASRSARVAEELVRSMPRAVHIEPQRTFNAFEPTPAGVELLLEHEDTDLDGVSVLNLMTDRWPRDDEAEDEWAQEITEAWIRTSSATYARAARRFLPDHELVPQ